MSNAAIAESPLASYFAGQFVQTCSDMSESEADFIQETIGKFIGHQISYDACVAAIFPVTNNMKPLEKLQSILSIPEQAIQPHNNSRIEINQLSQARKKSHAWTEYEDQRLLAAINRFGLDDWTTVSVFVGNDRSRSQCSQRWTRGLDPRISKDHWTSEQDEELMKLVVKYSDKAWTSISQDIGNRSDAQCRYRYKQLQREKGFEEKIQKVREVAASSGDLRYQNQPQKLVQRVSKKKTVKKPKPAVQFAAPIQAAYCFANAQNVWYSFPVSNQPQIHAPQQEVHVTPQNAAPVANDDAPQRYESSEAPSADKEPNFDELFQISQSNSLADWPLHIRPQSSDFCWN